jgi:hypothetical protein
MAEGGHQVIITTREDLISKDLISSKNVTAGSGTLKWLGQMSDASMAQLAPLAAKDDSSIGRLSEHSRASSVISLADSVFSSTSGSSKSSVVGSTGAGERFVLLLSDSHLSLLYQEALKRVTERHSSSNATARTRYQCDFSRKCLERTS